MEVQQAPSTYWVQMDSYNQTPPPLYEMPAELSSAPSDGMGGSPDSNQFDPYTIPFQTAYPHITEDLSFSTYPGSGPMTPDSSCIDDSPYCSPQLSIANIYPSPPMPSTAPFPPPQHQHQHQQSLSPRSSISISDPLPQYHSLHHSLPLSSAASSSDRSHATSSRRRAQNRAAQRAFRERKEKHARDLEDALSSMTEKWKGAEARVRELEGRYEKMRKTVELLVGCQQQQQQQSQQQSAKGEQVAPGLEGETMRRVLEVLCGEDGE